MSVLTEIHNRGVKDILIACVEGLTGFPKALVKGSVGGFSDVTPKFTTVESKIF